MRMWTLLVIILAAPPAAAQLPISGVGERGGARMEQIRRWFGYSTDEPHRIHDRHRSAELAGQIRQLRRRIGALRDSGQISRAEARAMRRETARVAYFYSAYRGGSISDSEAAELQNRIYVARSLVRPSRPPGGR